jgi:uncharacterized protein
VASDLARTEVIRAIRRSGGSTEVLAEQVLGTIDLIAIDGAVLGGAADAEPASLGTLDAIHLATALSIAPQLDAFITYDRDLARAAAAAGLPVESPGVP